MKDAKGHGSDPHDAFGDHLAGIKERMQGKVVQARKPQPGEDGFRDNPAHTSGIADAGRAAAFAAAKDKQAALEAESSRTGAIMRTFPSHPNGLTPDHVRATSEWRAAKAASDAAFAKLRNFNGAFVKTFEKELKAERMARNAARMKK